VLASIIDEFGLEKTNPEMKNNLKKAKLLPFTN